MFSDIINWVVVAKLSAILLIIYLLLVLCLKFAVQYYCAVLLACSISNNFVTISFLAVGCWQGKGDIVAVVHVFLSRR